MDGTNNLTFFQKKNFNFRTMGKQVIRVSISRSQILPHVIMYQHSDCMSLSKTSSGYSSEYLEKKISPNFASVMAELIDPSFEIAEKLL